ncbi:unnamed protein product [marine sediment metagenome]|uniref:Uncharacterized protein n=1 Tax=marine sediment metagenome TaxID=412755 RepID=X1JW51_9ZZZZ
MPEKTKIGVVQFSLSFCKPEEKGKGMNPDSIETGLVAFTDLEELRKVMHDEVDRMINIRK